MAQFWLQLAQSAEQDRNKDPSESSVPQRDAPGRTLPD
jgi:hypothetical protein